MGMLWRNGCDGKVLRCGAGDRHQHLQMEGIRCGRHRGRGFSYASTEACGGRRKVTVGDCFFSEKHLGFLSQPSVQAKHKFYRTKKKKELAAHLSMELPGHHDAVGFWVQFFSTKQN
jgi:hypothetical protein